MEATPARHATILLGMTGAAAAVMMPQFVVLLKQHGFAVRVMMTPAAAALVPATTMRAFSRGPVATLGDGENVHREWTRTAAALLIMPATGNVIGSIAAGIADDVVTAAALAATCPILIVPSMNGLMWSNPVVRRNVEHLRARGLEIIEPGFGIEIEDLRPSAGAMAPFPRVIQELNKVITSG